MSSNNTNIRLVQFSNYQRPQLEENKSKNWVLNGKNNCFYNYLIDRYNGSPTHATILNSYIDLFYGNGLRAKNANQNITDWVKLQQVLPKKELRKLISDFILFNQCSFQVGRAKDGKSLAYIYHLPKEKTAPSVENEEDEIEFIWYCKDWKNINKYKPEPFPSFGTSKEEIEVYDLKPYKAGKNYFSDPDYLSVLPYCVMEEEIANYCVNHIKNGLSFGYIINIPDGNSLTPEEQDEIEKKIKEKLTGSSNAGRFIISFNGRDAEITVTPLQVNDSHKQWQFLTTEARQQIMTGHKVVSPMLFGIKDNTGFGNNADELDSAETQLYKRVIQPKQRMFLEALDEILNAYNINLDLYFAPLTEQAQSTNEVRMSSQECCEHEKKNLDTIVADELISLGEDITDEWELVESEIYTNEAELSFTSTGTARPNAKSEIDGELFKSRLRYAGEIAQNSRQFCRKMIEANKLYRIEDINSMSTKVVNEGFGEGGSDVYDILLYKGGARCKHYWVRETYKKKDDPNNPNAKQVTPAEARKQGEILPTLDKKVYQKPNEMPNNGFVNPR